MTRVPAQAPPVAVVGLGALFPGGAGVQSFWTSVATGRDLIREVPRTHWLPDDFFDPDPRARDRVYARRGGFVDPVDFDFAAFGVPPSVLPATDPAQLLALWVARQALADAQGNLAELDRERVSVVLGVASTTQLCAQMAGRLQRPVWEKALRESGLGGEQVRAVCDRIASHFPEWQENTFPGLLGNVVAGRIANRLDLGGTNCVIDAACASSLAAVHLALDELYLGQSDAVVTGGVDALNDILMYMCFAKTGALSRSDDCRPFAAGADGTMLGEGIGMLVLRRLADAERDGNPIYAVIRGCGASSDGRSKSIYAPRADGQVRAYRRAYERAGYGPDSVELLEAHGTGTVAGDAAELAGLAALFGPGRPHRCAIGSVKSQIGHTKAAAGAASLIKTVLALRQGVLPPTIKAEEPAPELLDPETPFYLNTHARPWVRDGDRPRRAAVSSFGFGGSNYHVTVEEYRGPGRTAPRLRVAPTEVVILAAETPRDLAARCRELAAEARPGSLSFLAHRTQRDWRPDQPVRLAIVAADEPALAASLTTAAERLAAPGADQSGERLLGEGVYLGIGAEPGKVAFLFPGQGSQYPEMGADLAMFREEAAAAWDRAAQLCSGRGERLQDVVFTPAPPGADGEARRRENLRRPEWAQPALAAVSLAALRVLAAAGVTPELVAGHSFGELTALHAAGVWGDEDLLRAARARGEAMAAAATTPGAMTAVSQPVEATRRMLADLAPELVSANHNSPEQLVISGPVPVVERAEERLRQAGVRFARLPVASAFHSPLVAGAVATLQAHLANVGFAAPRIPVIAGSTADAYPADGDAARRLLANQLAEPVNFVGQVESLYRLGGRTFVEVGAGGVLTGLVDACLKGRPFRAVSIDRKGTHGVTALWHLLARLAVAGVPVKWSGLWEGFAPPAAPAERAATAVSLTGALYQKPYPSLASDAPVTPKPVAAPSPPLHPKPEQPVSVARPTESRFQPPAAPEEEHERARGTPAVADAEYLIGQLAEAQRAFQKQLLRGHRAFLRTLEALGGVRGETAPAPPPAPTKRRRSPIRRAAVPANGHVASAAQAAPLIGSARMNGTHAAPATNGKAAHPPAPARRPEPVQPPAPVSPAPASADRMKELVLATVSEKTGYPREVLGLQMDLESDLGIDSIKRVEILSAVHAAHPGLPELSPAKLGTLRTLGEVVAWVENTLATTTACATPQEKPAAEARTAPTASRAVLRATRQEAPGVAAPGLTPDALIGITDDGTGIAPALCAELQKAGLRAAVLDRAGKSPEVGTIILLDGLRDFASAEEAAACHRASFEVLRARGPQLARRGGLLVMVQDTGGSFGLERPAPGVRPWSGGLSALARTAAAEWPTISARAVDCERGGRTPAQVAAAVARELLRGGGEPEVGLSADCVRRVPRLVEEPVSAGPLPLGDGDVVVAVGGARGVTAACLEELAGRRRLRIALLGRTRLDDPPDELRGADEAALVSELLARAAAGGKSLTPAEARAAAAEVLAAREVRATLDRLRAAGSEVLYLTADCADPAATTAAVREVRRRWGSPRAVLFAAGVLADKLIAEKTDEQFDRVFGTKVTGLANVLAATEADPLKCLLLFSSVAARTGNRGQCDYAAANEVLNQVALAEASRRPGCLVRAFCWGPWDGGMVTPSLRQHFESRGVPLLPTRAGARAFADELTGDPGDVVLVLVGGLEPAQAATREAEVA
jgi:acyl transferase domain-containing protein/NADP-dependent 3-hydroxy acid dehydrogenase YdfG